jgi:quercetin dioxygenase-like cupin family protein
MSKFNDLTNDMLDVQHFFAAGLYAKQMTLNVGGYITGHVHLYDHMSILAKGSVVVNLDGVKKQYNAPAVITVKKGQAHDVYPLTDSVWYCLHATDLTDPDEIDEATSIRKPL